MANDDRQKDSLETLKLINAASTALRLYPEESVQVTDAIENAYRATKSLLREHEILRFSLLDGDFLLNGEAVQSQARERLQMLSFNDQLQRMELGEMVLCKGFDRTTFKSILSVFRATPEQVEKSGGSRSFVEELGLAEVFPEKYVPPGQSIEEQKKKKKIDRVLSVLAAGIVSPESILYLLGKEKGEKEKEVCLENFKSAEKSAHVIATATYSLLQILRKGHVVVVSSTFSRMLTEISSLIDDEGQGRHKELAEASAQLLVPYLDEASMLMLICQDFSSSFGEHYYDALLSHTGDETLSKLMRWMDGEQKKAGSDDISGKAQFKAVAEGHGRLLASSRGKEILEMNSARESLARDEQGRKSERLKAGIAELAKGEMQSLQDEEVCRSLPATIEQFLHNDKEPVAAAIIQNVVKGLKDRDNSLRNSFGQVTGGVAEKLALMNRWSWLERLTPACLAWIRETESADRNFEGHITAMQAMMNHANQSQNSRLGDQILNVLHRIRSGAAGKPEEMRQVVARVQDKNVDLAFMQSEVENSFAGSGGKDLGANLTMHGPVAARFLLDTLIRADKRPDRMRLLKALRAMGGELVPVLLERLPDPMPWYGKRNILRLLGETGSGKDSAAALDYIAHDEPRVQQEALQCIVQIEGEAFEEHLLQALPRASVQMKTQLVKNLRKTASEAVVLPLSELLEDCRLFSGDEKEALVVAICHTLGRSGSGNAIPVLRKVIDGGRKQFGKEGVEAAKDNISFVKAQTDSRREEQEGEGVDGGAEQESLSAGYQCITDHSEEKEVYDLLGRGEKETAKEMLLQLIEKTAQLKEFKAAEQLRQRLIEVDSMALTQIIRAAELIEEAQSSSMDQDHLLIWAELFDLLGPEEANAFYYSLVHDEYEAESMIVRQGQGQQQLFFVNEGQVELFFQEGEDEILIETLSSGQLFGGSSFFDDSVWTYSARCRENAEISALPRKDIEDWGTEYPGLEDKLRDYCLRVDRINDFFTSSEAERRKYERYPLSLPVMVEPHDVEDIYSDIIRGDGNDISRGGLSLHSRNIRGKDGRKLLGCSARVVLEDDNDDAQQLSMMGSIVAVRNLHSSDLGYCVHIRFEADIEEERLQEFIDES